MISEQQKLDLIELWEIYGNEGPKSTIGNHKLIQKLIYNPDADLNTVLDAYQTMFTEGGGGPKKSITDACLQEVNKILGN
jgi:hypothetical protein